MPLTQDELEAFYKRIVADVRAKGGVCAITSGMACVEFGVAQTTKDCDVLCDPKSARILFDVVESTELRQVRANYRGKLSPPLDQRWLRGGWTSHFFWKVGDVEAYLDVFGIAPRGSTSWATELLGLFAGPHTVAEMKRTDRDKDWPFATALGTNMLESGDARGWLHIFDADVMRSLIRRTPCPAPIVAQRPVLNLALEHDQRLEQAIHVEKLYWNALDRARLRVYERAVRPYLVAVRKAKIPKGTSLAVQHQSRLQCAERLLPRNPLCDYGWPALLDDAQRILAEFLPTGAKLDWLPSVEDNFRSLL